MENQQPPYVVETKDYSIREFNDTLSKTFTRMFLGLLVTAISAILTYSTSLINFVIDKYEMAKQRFETALRIKREFLKRFLLASRIPVWLKLARIA